MFNRSRFLPSLVALLLLACSAAPVAAQPSDVVLLSGTVVDDVTGEPIPGAHVFIANSMKGAVTDADGRYRLLQVPVGAHRIYVSIIGYEPAFRDVLLRGPEPQTFDFRLKERVVELDEVTVTGVEDPRWRERLEKFTRLFIGETPNAAETKILNPEVLDFDEKAGRFRAWASEPLQIENRALGYRITYFLKDFEATPTRTKYNGEPLFEELQPDGPDQQAMWTARRRAAYMGSFRHFIVSAINGRLEEEGFHLYHRQLSGPQASSMPMTGPQSSGGRFPIKADKLYKDGENPNEKVLDFHGFVEFVYEREVEDEAFLRWIKRPGRPKFQTSMLQLENGPTTVDYKGDTLDPYGVTFYGYLAFERVADEVPKEFRP